MTADNNFGVTARFNSTDLVWSFAYPASGNLINPHTMTVLPNNEIVAAR